MPELTDLQEGENSKYVIFLYLILNFCSLPTMSVYPKHGNIYDGFLFLANNT